MYALAALVQLIFPTFASAVVTRAASGLTAAALITVTIYYLFQVFPPKLRPVALVVGIGLTQLGVPLARLFPVEMLAENHWRNLNLIELALPLATLAAMRAFPLPPSDKSKAFEPHDFVTIALVVPAMLLFTAVLSVGRLQSQQTTKPAPKAQSRRQAPKVQSKVQGPKARLKGST